MVRIREQTGGLYEMFRGMQDSKDAVSVCLYPPAEQNVDASDVPNRAFRHFEMGTGSINLRFAALCVRHCSTPLLDTTMNTRRTLPVHSPVMRAAFTIAFGWLLLTCVGAAPAAAEISIAVNKPGADSLAEGDPLEIAVIVLSPPAEITSIQAAVGARTLTLTKDGVNTWSGSLSLTGLPRGPHQLVVTATNVAAETRQVTRPFIFNNPPTLTVTAPAEPYQLSGPDIRVSATCVDNDGPPCKLTVMALNGVNIPLAAGVGTIDTIVSSAEGRLLLAIFATDAVTNREVSVVRVLDVLSPRHRPVASYSGGILDITSDRALIVDGSVTPSVVRLVDRATNTSQIIWTAQLHPTLDRYEFVGQGFLTVSGALLETQFGDGTGQSHLREWRGGALTDLGVVQSTSTRVKGRWATSTLFSPPGQLMLRDLLTGTSTVVTDKWLGHDFAPDGRVVYTSPSYEIMSFEPGPPPSTTQVTFGSPAWSLGPKTDGVNVVFQRLPESQVGPASLVLRTSDGTEIVLADRALVREYHVNNGWIAFVRQGPGFALELWRRAPDGTERQLAVIVGDIYIWELSDTGEVLFDKWSGASGGRYLARPDGTVVGVPSGFKPILIDGAWHALTASHLLAVDMTVPSRSILAEGATGTFFTTDVAILNPHGVAVPVTVRYLRENAPEIAETRTLPALSRTTIRENSIAGLEHASVSTVVDAPAATPVVVERLMTWDATGYGGHLGTSVDQPRSRWLFAEGAQGFFHTFFLLANSGHSEAEVKFTFLVELGTPVSHTVRVAPGERKTIYAGDVADLINRSFATVIESNVPIVAERAMYFGDSPIWLGGHGSAGVPELTSTWFYAEGATGSLFDTFILLANPHPVDVRVRITYTTDAGQVIVRGRTLPAASRLTINLEDEGPELANVAVATRVESLTLPIVSERTMYWGTTGAGWREAHNTFGMTQTGVKWGLAEGRAGGPRAYQTFVLVSNLFKDYGPANLRVTFVKEDGTTVVRTFDVPPSQRFSIDTSGIAELANSNFSTIVESINGLPINVESAIYWSVNGVTWEGGGNTIATRLW
jgi:hypothetical protein